MRRLRLQLASLLTVLAVLTAGQLTLSSSSATTSGLSGASGSVPRQADASGAGESRTVAARAGERRHRSLRADRQSRCRAWRAARQRASADRAAGRTPKSTRGRASNRPRGCKAVRPPSRKPPRVPQPPGTPTPPTPPTPPAPPVIPDPVPTPPTAPGEFSPLQVGVQFHGVWGHYTDADRAVVLDRLSAMGAGWVRVDVSWAMLQPRPGAIDPNSWGVRHIDNVFSMAHARGLKVLATLWLAPEWANGTTQERTGPKNPADYGKALAWAARHWKGTVQAWEVWNEPNSADFFTSADPAEYTRLLCAASAAVEADSVAREVPVVFGGPMYNDAVWIDKAYRAGAGGCFDIMATHPYVGVADQGPRHNSGRTIWDFEHLHEVRRVMARYGDTSPVWLTEFGWSSHANRGNEANWQRGVTEAQQAAFTVEALEILQREFPWVERAFLYNERERTDAGLHMQGYGILRPDMSPKPIYHALQRHLRG